MIRRSNEITLKDAIESLLDAYKLTGKLNETRLIASWDKVVGNHIARHTDDLYVRGETLFVKLDSAALKNELSMARTKLVTNLNRVTGINVITDIRFI